MLFDHLSIDAFRRLSKWERALKLARDIRGQTHILTKHLFSSFGLDNYKGTYLEHQGSREATFIASFARRRFVWECGRDGVVD